MFFAFLDELIKQLFKVYAIMCKECAFKFYGMFQLFSIFFSNHRLLLGGDYGKAFGTE